jgi:hypothetical protein
MTTSATNGGAPSLPHADELIARLQQLIDERTVRRDELVDELAHVDRELKAYAKSLAPLLPEALAPPPAKRGRPPRGEGERVRAKQSRIGPERMELIEAAARQLGKDDAEFRQVDVRRETGLTSSIMTSAFRQMRDDNIVRLARRDGINQWFKLTRPAGREGDE